MAPVMVNVIIFFEKVFEMVTVHITVHVSLDFRLDLEQKNCVEFVVFCTYLPYMFSHIIEPNTHLHRFQVFLLQIYYWQYSQ